MDALQAALVEILNANFAYNERIGETEKLARQIIELVRKWDNARGGEKVVKK